MRLVDGYICLASSDKNSSDKFMHYILFGKKINETYYPYENLQTNGLIPYASIKEAKEAQKRILKRKNFFDRADIRKLEMKIAQTEEEHFSFEKEKSLVVIWTNDFGIHIIGRWEEETTSGIYPLYGALIENNGLKPYTNFSSADYSRSEASRQSDNSPATLATFKISKIISTRRKK